LAQTRRGPPFLISRSGEKYQDPEGHIERFSGVSIFECDFCFLALNSSFNVLGNLEVELNAGILHVGPWEVEVVMVRAYRNFKEIHLEGRDDFALIISGFDDEEFSSQILRVKDNDKFFFGLPLHEGRNTFNSLESGDRILRGRSTSTMS
jgi:hypothetical protein